VTGRRRTYVRRCSTTGCRETSQIEYTARRDIEGVNPTWTCRKHDKPNEYLSTTNLEQTAVLELHPKYRTNMDRQEVLLGNYWGPEGEPDKAHHGIVSGPGFWADAKNFPAGTRLTVTARAELPTDGQAVPADPRQAAYDAVFAYIRQQPRDFLPTTVVDRNAMIWHAVHAALDAVGIPRKDARP